MIAKGDMISGSRKPQLGTRKSVKCGNSALVVQGHACVDASLLRGGWVVKKLAVAVALVVASLSLAGCFVGKGKAPPPPVVTKG